MNDLATLAINAHGGLERWRRLKTVSAHLLQGGVLWKVKGQDGVLDDVHLTVDLRKGESFRDRKWESPWDTLQLAYFAGYAMWTYMNGPFLFALPDVKTEELESWQENGEAWRRLKVTFPKRIATHSAQQTFYFDRQGLLKRHDYDVDIAGGTPAAHYVSAPTDVLGIVVPTKHRIFPRQLDGSSAPAPLVVSIDISDIEFS